MVLEFPDKYDYFKKNYKNFPSVKDLKEYFDLVITYNIDDVKKYGFTLCRPAISDYSYVAIDESIEPSDVFFVGQNKGRLEQIHGIYEKCVAAGLKNDFYIVGVEKKDQKYQDIHYNTPIPYDEVLKRVKRTKCILNIVQENGNGITMRDYEAFGNDKLLLTNNVAIKGTEFDNRDQIIWLDELEERTEDIKKGFIGHRDYSKQYSEDQRLKWLNTKLFYE